MPAPATPEETAVRGDDWTIVFESGAPDKRNPKGTGDYEAPIPTRFQATGVVSKKRGRGLFQEAKSVLSL